MIGRAKSLSTFLVLLEERGEAKAGRLLCVSLVLDGVAMLWFDVLNVQGHTIKRGKWLEEKEYLKKWEGQRAPQAPCW